MKADTIKDVDIKRLLLKLESAFLTHQEVDELVDKVKRLEGQVKIARPEEREVCAKLCEEYQFDYAAAIRGRTE